MPRWVWSALWLHGENAVRLMLGGELIEVQPQGQWEPPMPSDNSPKALPEPKTEESHQAYFLRVLALYKGKCHPQEHRDWIASRKWVGESAKALCAAIAAGQDLPTHQWTFINEKPI